MKRTSYKEAIQWVSDNDSAAEDLSMEECGELITAVLVADLFDVPTEKVGEDIYIQRVKNNWTVDSTCGCGLYIHPQRRNRKAIHMLGCLFGPNR